MIIKLEGGPLNGCTIEVDVSPEAIRDHYTELELDLSNVNPEAAIQRDIVEGEKLSYIKKSGETDIFVFVSEGAPV